MTAPRSNSGRMLKAALAYAAMGWHVFPVHTPVRGGGCSCGGDTCGSIGKHPRTAHGVKDATTDPEQIRAWWTEWPTANIGVATGRISGIVVLDIDPRNGGDESLDALREHLAETVTGLTGGNGQHLVNGYPPGVDRIKGRPLAPGIDVKADGGYIVVPPSLHASGRHYRWEISSRPDEMKPAPLPEAILERMLRAIKPVDGAHSSDGRTARECYLGVAFQVAGWTGRLLAEGKLAVRCPWTHLHTGGEPYNSSTVLFPPQTDRTMGYFVCLHSHCSSRTLREVLDALPRPAIEAADLAYPPMPPGAPPLAAPGPGPQPPREPTSGVNAPPAGASEAPRGDLRDSDDGAHVSASVPLLSAKAIVAEMDQPEDWFTRCRLTTIQNDPHGKDPPVHELLLPDSRVILLDDDDFLSAAKFQRRCIRQRYFPPLPGGPRGGIVLRTWSQYWFEHGRIVAAPEESGDAGTLRAEIRAAIDNAGKAESQPDLERGLVLERADGHRMFMARPVMRALHGTLPVRFGPQDFYEALRRLGCTQTVQKVGEAAVRGWMAPVRWVDLGPAAPGEPTPTGATDPPTSGDNGSNGSGPEVSGSDGSGPDGSGSQGPDG